MYSSSVELNVFTFSKILIISTHSSIAANRVDVGVVVPIANL